MLFCDIKDEKLKNNLRKVHSIRCYEFLYLNDIYPITEGKYDEQGMYFEYMPSQLLDEMLEEFFRK